MSAENVSSAPAPFGYFLNICSLMHFGYFSDAEKALTDFLEGDNKTRSELLAPDVPFAINTARVLRDWVRAKQEYKNG